jgi:maleate cis-trans isomerase
LVAYFIDNGLAVANAECLGFEDDREMARISPASIIDAGESAMADDAEAMLSPARPFGRWPDIRGRPGDERRQA